MIRRRSRVHLLFVGLVVVAGAWVGVNVGTLRSLWWERQPLEKLQQVAEMPDADALVRQVYTRRLVRLGRADDAIGLLQGLVRELPAGATGGEAQSRYAELAHALALVGQTEEAKAAREKARALDPNDPLLILTDAWIDASERRYDLAAKTAAMFVGIRPNDPEAHRLLGVIGNASRKPETALEPLRRSLALAPEVGATHAELGHALAALGRYAEAVPEFRRAVALDPDADVYRRVLGDALSLSARTPPEYAEARRLLEEALAATPDDVTLAYTLAQVEVRSHALDKALPRLRAVLAANPRNNEARYLLAYVQRRFGDTRAAQTDEIAFRNYNRVEDQIVDLQARIAQKPGDPALRLALARVFRAARNPIGARAQLQTALQLKPGLPVPASERAAIDAEYAAHRRAAGESPDDPRLNGPPPPGGALGLPNLTGGMLP